VKWALQLSSTGEAEEGRAGRRSRRDSTRNPRPARRVPRGRSRRLATRRGDESEGLPGLSHQDDPQEIDVHDVVSPQDPPEPGICRARRLAPPRRRAAPFCGALVRGLLGTVDGVVFTVGTAPVSSVKSLQMGSCRRSDATTSHVLPGPARRRRSAGRISAYRVTLAGEHAAGSDTLMRGESANGFRSVLRLERDVSAARGP
jgi:hypothetical protein